MHAYARAYSKLCQFHYIYICVCVYIYSNGNVLPSILVPVYVLYIFCYHTLLYGGNKEIYLSNEGSQHMFSLRHKKNYLLVILNTFSYLEL